MAKIAILGYNIGMDAKVGEEGESSSMEDQNRVCPECGSQESGYFCRNCGALLSEEDNILCPRCHHIVPDGKFCNQCGQGLTGLGLHLRQLAMAGDAFWITSVEESLAPPAVSSGEPSIFEPDESVQLAQAELPDWLSEISAPPAPAKAEPRIYPALKPIEPESGRAPQRNFLVTIILLMLVMLVGLVFMAILFVLRGMG